MQYIGLMTNRVSLAENDSIPGGYDNEASSIIGTPNATAKLIANQLCLPTRTLKKIPTMPHTVVPPVHCRNTHNCLNELLALIMLQFVVSVCVKALTKAIDGL